MWAFGAPTIAKLLGVKVQTVRTRMSEAANGGRGWMNPLTETPKW